MGFSSSSGVHMISLLFIILGVLVLTNAARNIYVDLGANNGESVKSFVHDMSDEGNVAINGGAENRKALKDFVGVVKDWEVYVFEANPVFDKRLQEQKELMEKNHTVKAYHLFASTAISVSDGTISFILDNPGEVGDAGSTTMSESRSAVGKSLTVNSTDIITLFKTIGNFAEADNILVKMDVEGAEYQIVRRIIQKGLLPLIDRIGVEWHHEAAYVFGHPDGYFAHNTTVGSPYQKQLFVHNKYLRQYKELMSRLGPDEAKKFTKWD